MGFIKVSCPSCGAQVQFDNDKDFCFCTYCGAKIMQEKIVVEHRGKISVDGISNEQAYLNRAFIFLEDENFSQAYDYLEKVLDLNPFCSKAYLGKLLCRLKCKRIDLLADYTQKPLNCYDEFNKAKRFANSDEIEDLNTFEKTIQQHLEQKINAEITESKKKITALNNYFNKYNNSYTQLSRFWANQRGCGFWLMATLSTCLVFSILGIIASASDKSNGVIILSIFSVILFVPLFILFKTRSKFQKIYNEYQSKKYELETEENKLEKLYKDLRIVKDKDE